MRSLKFSGRLWWFWLGLAGVLYVAAAMLVYQFRHPYLTDTERIQRFGDAMAWRR